MMDGSASAPAEHAFEPAAAEALVDPRLRGLVERYTALVGATVQELEPQLVELSLPDTEIAHFRGRDSIRVAFSLAALERHPEAKLAVVGGALFRELLDAIRTHGQRRACGLIPPVPAADATSVALTVPVRGGSADQAAVSGTVHPAARLVARVAIEAAAIVEEHIAESGVFDLATGERAPEDLADLCLDVEWGRVPPAGADAAAGFSPLPARPLAELVPLMLRDIEGRVAAELARHRHDARQALVAELARIDGYYDHLLDEAVQTAGGNLGADERRAIEAEHRRRRAEAERRREVRGTVHPLQFVEFELLVQRADWALGNRSGRRANLAAQRTLSGSGAWGITCPTCRAPPSELLVCRHDHVACAACGKTCAVCGEDFCGAHGIAECHVDRQPACDAHAKTCPACGRAHCTAHEGTCADGGHSACTACLGACGACGKVVCATHAAQSDAGAPRGGRRLCRACVVYCQGGTNEPVGRDEAVRCASCDGFVCAHHQGNCAVDQQVHCSRHLAPLHDTLRDWGCERHRTVCHIDQLTYSVAGTKVCPLCERPTCAAHLRHCDWCGRAICQTDMEGHASCFTCRRLAHGFLTSDALVAAAIRANMDGPTIKACRSARDATHTVVELDLGLNRKLVLAVRHGDGVPETVVRHAAFGRTAVP